MPHGFIPRFHFAEITDPNHRSSERPHVAEYVRLLSGREVGKLGVARPNAFELKAAFFEDMRRRTMMDVADGFQALDAERPGQRNHGLH